MNLEQLRKRHRPEVIAVMEERSRGLRAWKDSQDLASKFYRLKHGPGALRMETNSMDGSAGLQANGDLPLKPESAEGYFSSLTVDGELDSVPDLKEQVIFSLVDLLGNLCLMFHETDTTFIQGLSFRILSPGTGGQRWLRLENLGTAPRMSRTSRGGDFLGGLLLVAFSSSEATRKRGGGLGDVSSSEAMCVCVLSSTPVSYHTELSSMTLLKVELCRLLEEKRSAVLRSEELETALMEMVRQDNRRLLSARVLMRIEQEQKVTEDARLLAEQNAAAQKYAAYMLKVLTCH
ncbi:hypothetical protein BHM03_00021579 [Ensete ventricosum]|nr:hypothetical protein BHM03_00021579 [Ensete ventricosum]